MMAISSGIDVGGHEQLPLAAAAPHDHVKTQAAFSVKIKDNDAEKDVTTGLREDEDLMSKKSDKNEGAALLEGKRRASAWEQRIEGVMQTLGFQLVDADSQHAHRADDPQDSQEVPYYFFNLPISIKFTGTTGAESTIVIMDRFQTVKVDSRIVYIYPIVLFVFYTLSWAICCMRSNRTGLSFRVICEAATCFMCLWADLATKHKVISATRAWSYIFAMMALLTAWNCAAMVAHGNDGVFYVFQSLVVGVWFFFAVERMFVRKMFRRIVDPMSSDHYCADCALQVCCGQFTALQEAQFMAEVGTVVTDGKGALPGSGGTKW